MAKRKPKSKVQLLNELEKLIGAQLPADYRAFMKTFDGKTPDARQFEVRGPRDRYWSELVALWPLRGRDCSVAGGWGLLDAGGESHLMIIGDDGTGNWICLAVRGKERGQVCYVDHEYEPGEKQRVVKLADSFDEFMSSLTMRPNGP